MLSSNEQATLKLFCRICDELDGCRFLQNLNHQDHTIRVSRNPAENRFPRYDKDDFRSFATILRKIIAAQEPANIFRVMKIIGRYVSDADQAFLKEIKRHLRREANHPPISIAIGPPGSETPYSPEDIRNIFFNGLIFHSDAKLQDHLITLLEYEPFVMVTFLRYAAFVASLAVQLADLIAQRRLAA